MFPEQKDVYDKIHHVFSVFEKSEAEIRPHFFLTGDTGSGKSYIIQSLAGDMEISMFEINAAQLTAEGLSGNSLSKALRPLRTCWDKPNIIFIDEFDKLFQRNGEATSDHQASVQDEFLQILEATKASIFTDYGKYEPVVISNSLFVFAGAFSNQSISSITDLRNAGMRNEFLGRVPLVLQTPTVLLQSMVDAVPDMKLFQEYMKMYPKTKKPSAVKAIRNDITENSKKSEIGIRYINYAIHQYFMKEYL